MNAIGRLFWLVAIAGVCAGACGGARLGGAPQGDAGISIGDGGGAMLGWELQALPSAPGQPPSWDLLDMGGAGSDLYVVGWEGHIFQSINGGDSWANIGPQAGLGDSSTLYPYVSSISVSAIDDVWITVVARPDDPAVGTASERSLVHSGDRGQSWQRISAGSAQPVDVWAADRDRALVVGLGGEIWRTTDAGTTWARVFSDVAFNMMDVWGTSGSDVYAVGVWAPGTPGADGTLASGGFVLHSPDGGATWQTVLTDAACSLWYVAGTLDGQAVYATGGCGSMVWTDDHGASWSKTGSLALSDSRYSLGHAWVSPAGNPQFPVEYGQPTGASVCNWLVASDTAFAPTGCATVPGRRQETSGTMWVRPTGVWGLSEDDLWAYGPQAFLWRKRAAR